MTNKFKILTIPIFASTVISYISCSNLNKVLLGKENKQTTWDSQPPTNYLPEGFTPKVIRPFNNGYATTWIFIGTSDSKKYNMVFINQNQPFLTEQIGSAENVVNSFYVLNSKFLWVDTDQGEWYVESKSDTYFEPSSVYQTDWSVYIPLQASELQRGWYGDDKTYWWHNWNLIFIDKNTHKPRISYQDIAYRKSTISNIKDISNNLNFNNIVKNQNIYLTATKNKPSDEATLYRYAPKAFLDNNLTPLNFKKNILNVVSESDDSKNLYILSDDGVYYYNYDTNTFSLVTWKIRKDLPDMKITDMDMLGEKMVVIAKKDQESSRMFEIDLNDYSYDELFFDNQEYLYDVDLIKKIYLNQDNKLSFFYQTDNTNQTTKDFFYIDIPTLHSVSPFTPINPDSKKNNKNKTAYIVGGVLGSIATISLVGFAVYYFTKRKSSR